MKIWFFTNTSLSIISVYHQGKNICEGGDEMDIASAEGAGTEIDPSTGQVKHGGCGRCYKDKVFMFKYRALMKYYNSG